MISLMFGRIVVAAFVLAAGGALAADLQFSTPLDPVAFDNSTIKNNVGNGNVTATLSGSPHHHVPPRSQAERSRRNRH